jgi:hypothetical protein
LDFISPQNITDFSALAIFSMMDWISALIFGLGNYYNGVHLLEVFTQCWDGLSGVVVHLEPTWCLLHHLL